MGTSSWSFPGWRGVVYAGEHSRERLSRAGLRAYAAHPLLRAVGLDRTFYAPLARRDYRAHADQVPEDFRFLVKAGSAITSPRTRDGSTNPDFLDPDLARRAWLEPAREGLGEKLGVLLFQMPPLRLDGPREIDRLLDRLGRFFSRLPDSVPRALEIRHGPLLGDHHARLLRDEGVAHGYTVHPRMPEIERQQQSLGPGHAGPLVVRWMLGGGQRYEAARARYAPFDRIVDPDPRARGAIARLCTEAHARGHQTLVIANNKAEGSAPKSLFALAGAVAEALDAEGPERSSRS